MGATAGASSAKRHRRRASRRAFRGSSTPRPKRSHGTHPPGSVKRSVTQTSLIEVPAGGERIVPGEPVPATPIIPYIEGDGIGVDITPVMQRVVDAAVERAYDGDRRIAW